MDASTTSARTPMVATWSFCQAQYRAVSESSWVTASGSTLLKFYKMEVGEFYTRAGAKEAHREFSHLKPNAAADCSSLWSGFPPAKAFNASHRLSFYTSVAGMVLRSSLNLSLGWLSFQDQPNSWHTLFLWLSPLQWAASLLNASVVFSSDAAISRAE